MVTYKPLAEQIRTGALLLNGINDSMALTYNQGVVIGHYAERYRYYNMNFPKYVGEITQIPATSWREFYHKMMWLVQNLGGVIGFDPKYGYSDAGSMDTRLNHIRLGPHSSYGGDIFAKCFYNKRDDNDEIMDGLFLEAELHEIAVNLTLGYTPGTGSTSFFGGDVCILDSAPYLKYVKYCVDVINAYNKYKMLAIVDLFNEPATYGSINNYWKPKYGTVVEANGKEAWENKYYEWQNRLLSDVRTEVAKTNAELPLIIIGNGMKSVNYWHSAAEIAKELEDVAFETSEEELIVGHPYWGAEDDYLLNWKARTSNTLGKFTYLEELGYNQTTSASPPAPGFWIGYWPWADIDCNKHKLHKCWMQLNAMEAPTPVDGAYVYPKPPYSGYPISQNVMDNIPPVDSHVPPPPPLVVSISSTEPTGYKPVLVNFTSSVEGGVQPYSYLWDFGNGVSSTEAAPSVVFDVVGEYTVVMQVTDSKGTKTTSNEIKITVLKPLPVPIGFVPAYDLPISAQQIQQGKVIVKIPDVTTPLPNGSTSATIASGFTAKIFNKPYPCSVTVPALPVKMPAITITMPTIQFDLPPVNIPAGKIHVGTMVVYSEQQ